MAACPELGHDPLRVRGQPRPSIIEERRGVAREGVLHPAVQWALSSPAWRVMALNVVEGTHVARILKEALAARTGYRWCCNALGNANRRWLTAACSIRPSLPILPWKVSRHGRTTLLDDYPDGGVVMTAAVRRLAGTEVATVSDLIALAKGAKVPQIVAIGAGLAGAVNVCTAKRPDLAKKIIGCGQGRRRTRRCSLHLPRAFRRAKLPQWVLLGAAATPPGRASVVEPQVKAPPVEDVDSSAPPRRKRPFGEEQKPPRASFGNGGIVRTVVKPVSPAR